MKKKLILAVVTVCLFLVSGCATVSMLPDDSRAAFSGLTSEGKVGWSSYNEQAVFKDYSLEDMILAAKHGLATADFALRKVDKEGLAVVGEHGMTLHDWNVIAGVYFNKVDAGWQVLVVAEGSKDIGFSGDVTQGAWTGRILRGMREYVANYAVSPK